MLGCELDSAGSGLVPVAGFIRHGNELSNSIKGAEFLNHLNHCQFFKKDSGKSEVVPVCN
jgi:hypothetical protein